MSKTKSQTYWTKKDTTTMTTDTSSPENATMTAPVLDAPVLDAPVLDAPVLDAPVLDAPVLDAPVLDAPTSGEVMEATNGETETLDRDYGTPVPDPNKPYIQAKGKIREVPFEKIYSEKEFNIRDKDAYNVEGLETLSDSLKMFGMEQPLVVSEKPDGRFKILQGHRRFECVKRQRAAYEATNSNSAGAPWQKLRCDVRVDLSESDETLVMLDHGNVLDLSPHEMWKAVQRLAAIPGMTETKICAKLGKRRTKLATHNKVAQLPSEVQRQYSAYLRRDDGALKLTAPVVNKLHEAQTADKKSKKIQFGNGPEFSKAWKEVKQSVETGEKPRTKSESAKKKLDDLVSKRLRDPDTGHILLFNWVKHILGESEGLPDFNDITDQIVKALHEMYPPEDEDEEVTVTEEGISRTA